jgi:putative membrane protein
MLNIFRIFMSDFKRLKTNVVAVVMVIGLSILPCLYAWFNILSNWSPYGPDPILKLRLRQMTRELRLTTQNLIWVQP